MEKKFMDIFIKNIFVSVFIKSTKINLKISNISKNNMVIKKIITKEYIMCC